jgi:hypothetical protein
LEKVNREEGDVLKVKRALFLSLLLASLSIFSPLAQASVKAGSACSKVGTTTKSNGLKYTCVKSGKKLAWKKVAAVPKASPSKSATPKSSPSKTPTPTGSPTNSAAKSTASWQFDFKTSTWKSQGDVPKCSSPLIATGALLDFSKVVSFVQPGQVRGGSYKPHAGLRWSEYGGYVKGITITAPFDGEIVGVAQYTTEGIYQFLVNIVNPCGVMLRLGHMQAPSDFMKGIFKNVPAPQENDSRETFVSGVFIKKGQVIATEVGMPAPASPDSLGTFMDLGIVDLHGKNSVLPAGFSSNADPKYSLYSVCWYEGDYFSQADRTIVQNLPFSNGDPTSSYCKRGK